jgi:hypothetical protein|tara:strand:- start:310 stop:552 length:243 start_codon:yes stop_codon:yes gene_type:complete
MSELLNLANKFLLMSELLSDTDEEKVASKQRIVFATMRKANPEWQPPGDWDELPTEEKLRRLNGIQEILKENNNETNVPI